MDNLKVFVRGAYDIQKLRIQTGNRIVANFKTKLGQAPSQKEETLDKEGKEILKKMREDYKKIMDPLKTFPRMNKFRGHEVISDYTELCLMDQYIKLEKQEDDHFRRLGEMLDQYPIYTNFLKGIKGVGPAMAGVIISEIDIRKAKYASSIWKYAGLDVADNGQGRSKKKEHLVEIIYKDKNGEQKERVGITFNPFLKTKLVGVLASSFLRVGRKGYGKIYDDYKHRIENEPKHIEKSKGHRHNMALRYMIKIFLIDLYAAWRPLEGLPVSPTYQEAKLGKNHRLPKASQNMKENHQTRASHVY